MSNARTIKALGASYSDALRAAQGLSPWTAADDAREAYLRGQIEIDELERRLDVYYGLNKPVTPTRLLAFLLSRVPVQWRPRS